jgi:hypothetical protein
VECSSRKLGGLMDWIDDIYFYQNNSNEELNCPIPEEIFTTSWNGTEATGDDWLDTFLYIKQIKEKV